MVIISEVSSSKCFGGYQKVFKHSSVELKCEMHFSAYIPPQASEKKCAVMYWLSGLTCTEKNFIEKSGFQRHASKHGFIVVGPDTSPRGCNIEGEESSYDFGSGAGFYVDATEEKWKNNYRMYSYVTIELPSIVNDHFPVNGKSSIFGHSMGGHGALVIGLKNPDKYISISAFAPICNPTEGIWGKKCLTGYLGKDCNAWKLYNASLLAKSYEGRSLKILVDQGSSDPYIEDELMPQNLIEACKNSKITLDFRMQEGYDHGYYFISTFIGDHFDFHAKHLNV